MGIKIREFSGMLEIDVVSWGCGMSRRSCEGRYFLFSVKGA